MPREFLICHENEYIDGDESCFQILPIKPNLPLKGNSNFVSAYSYESLDGSFIEKLIVEKKTMDIEAVCIGEDNLASLNDAIDEKIKQYGSRFFYLNYYHPVCGWKLSKVYIGTPYEAETLYLSVTDGSDTVTKLKFSIIEVDGTKING